MGYACKALETKGNDLGIMRRTVMGCLTAVLEPVAKPNVQSLPGPFADGLKPSLLAFEAKTTGLLFRNLI